LVEYCPGDQLQGRISRLALRPFAGVEVAVGRKQIDDAAQIATPPNRKPNAIFTLWRCRDSFLAQPHIPHPPAQLGSEILTPEVPDDLPADGKNCNADNQPIAAGTTTGTLFIKHYGLTTSQLRLERRGQDGQSETEQPDHSASLGDSITPSTRIRFSVHTPSQMFATFKLSNVIAARSVWALLCNWRSMDLRS
jgi:hypothetical protein